MLQNADDEIKQASESAESGPFLAVPSMLLLVHKIIVISSDQWVIVFLHRNIDADGAAAILVHPSFFLIENMFAS
jgi:hypothetical protein